MATEQSVHIIIIVSIIIISLSLKQLYILLSFGHLSQHCPGGGGIGFGQDGLRQKTSKHSGLKGGIALVNGDMNSTTATATRKNFIIILLVIAINSG